MPDEYDAGVMARILICEDELLFAEDLATTLRDLGYEIVGTVVTGEEAIRKAEEVRPALILMDINLAGEIDGIEAAGRISNKFDIPVVYLTAYAETDIIERAKHTEPYGYVSKPVSLLQLKSTVATALYKHKADRMVRESEARFRKVFEQGPIGMGLVGTDGRFLVVNSQLCQMLGYTEDELTRLTFVDITHPDHVAQDLEAVSRLYDGEIPHYKAEKRYIKKDGDILWGDLTVAAIRDAEGKLLYTLPMVEDITDRKNTEEALRKSDAQKQAILDGITANLAFVNQDLEIQWVNRAAADSVGKLPSQMVGRTCHEFWADPDKPCDRCPTVKAFKTKKSEHTTMITPDGRVWDEKGEPVFDEHGKLVGVVEIAWDITERKRAEEELRQSRERLSLALEGANIGIWDWDLTTGKALWSERSLQMLGYEPEEFEPNLKNWKKLVHADDWPQVAKNFNDHIQGKLPTFEAEYRILNKSGGWQWVQGRGTVVESDANGQPVRMTGVAVDISARKEAEEALRESQERFSLAMEATQDGLWDWNMLTDDVYRSPGFFSMLGYQEEDFPLSFEGWKNLVHPDDLPQTLEALNDYLSGRRPTFSVEFRMLHKSGESVWVLSRGRVVERDATGKPIRMIGTHSDISERKKADEELRKSEARYRFLTDHASDLLWTLDMNLRTTFVSPSVERVLGFTPEERMRQVVEDQLTPDSLEIARQRLLEELHIEREQGIREGKSELIDLDYYHKNGSIVCLQTAVTFIRDEKGTPIGLHGISRDITELKRSQEALRESETKYRTLFEQISSAVAVYKAENEGEDFIFVDFNRAGEEMEHVGREKLLGRSVLEVFPGVREFGLFDVFQRVWRTGVPERYPVALYKDQRIEGWRDNFVYKLPTGEIVAVYSDETERRRAEEALREREQMLTSLLSASPVGIGLASFERKMLWVNESWLSIFGFEDEHECLGMPARNLYPSEDEFTRVGDLVTVSMAESSIGETEARMVKKDGSVFDAHIRVNPIDSTDENKGFIAAIEDISDRKRGAEEQERLRAQLLQAQKMEAIGTLAGGIAHDFNNLLQVVLGYSELLLAEKEEDDRDYGDLQKIFQSAKSGAELVRRLLLFSRKTESKPVPMNLNHRIGQIEKLLRRTIPKMVDINLDLSGDLPRVYADPSQMEQVMMNLAVNARDAMPDVGKLTMRTALVTLDEEYCRFHVEASPGEYVLLEVADTGHGMDKETVEHIFEPFFTTKEMGRGTGLGLAMVHGIVKQHGGHITCSSEIGKGTMFKVYLPAMSTEIENVADSLAEIPTSGTETVLLVDDEDFVRELGQRILTRSGYKVLTASNGEEALDVYRRQRDKISLIILDLMMPGMGGKVCLRELLGINPKVKVLIASGYSADEATKESGVVGARGFIAKPFRFKDFLQQVRKTLDER